MLTSAIACRSSCEPSGVSRKRSSTAPACRNPVTAGGPVVAVVLGRIVGMPEPFAPSFMLGLSIPRSFVGAVLVIVSLSAVFVPYTPAISTIPHGLILFSKLRVSRKFPRRSRVCHNTEPRGGYGAGSSSMLPRIICSRTPRLASPPSGFLKGAALSLHATISRLRDCSLPLTGSRDADAGAAQ